MSIRGSKVDSDDAATDATSMFSNRELGMMLFDEPDYDAQQRAIRDLLRLRRQADEKFQKDLNENENVVKRATGRTSDHAIDEWVDHLHSGVFQDAAHSMAAVGMLAPFIESLFEQAFYGIQGLFRREGLTLKSHKRLAMKPDTQWNCHYLSNGRKELVKGIFELSKATGLEPHLPIDLKLTLEALYGYRNRNFHLGFEWPTAEREKFARRIVNDKWPKTWFEKSETDGKPWIFYMSEAFTDHCLEMIEKVIESLGAFVRSNS